MQQNSIVALADDFLKVIEQTTENNKKYVEDKLYASYNSDHYKFV